MVDENTEGYLEKAGLFKLTRDICIKKGTVPGNTGRMGTLALAATSPFFFLFTEEALLSG
jgi:hypothetical protein